ncbi:MAG: hypothetical protein U5R49_00510 [Deltaproteobacteria bacterium]|nr:hypothetical protein [Deltaproteobacteria bacterium]
MKDTRTNVIDEINMLKGFTKVVIAKELRIHSQDLKRLKMPYGVVPLLEINTFSSDEDWLFVFPSNITAKSIVKSKSKLESMQRYIDRIEKSSIIRKIGDNGETCVDIYSINPSILLVKYLPKETLKIDINSCRLSSPYKGDPLVMSWNGSITTPTYLLGKDNYELLVTGRGTKAFDQYAKLKIEIQKEGNKEKAVLIEKTFDTKEDFIDFLVPFDVKERSNISFVVSFINDRSNPKTNEDRNVYLKSIILKRIFQGRY